MSNGLELYGDRTSNCFRVAIALEEAGLPYTVRRVDLNAGAHFDQAVQRGLAIFDGATAEA